MDFVEKLFKKHGTRAPGWHDDHGWRAVRPNREDSHGHPWSMHASTQEHAGYRADDPGLQGRLERHGLLGVLRLKITLEGKA